MLFSDAEARQPLTWWIALALLGAGFTLGLFF